MNLNIFKENDFAELTIVDQYGEDTDFVLKVRNPECKEARNIINRWDKRGKAKKNGLDVEQTREAAIEYLAACVESWSGLVDGGKPVECNMQNKIEVLTNYPLIREQVDQFIGEKQNFLSVGGKS